MLLLTIQAMPSSAGNPVISASELRDYIIRYLKEYRDLVDAYKTDLTNLGMLEFYSNYPYRVVCIISKTNGVAIFFYHSTEQKIEIKTIYERIEFNVWPIMLESCPAASTFWEREYSKGQQIDTYSISANLQIGDGVTPTYFYHSKGSIAVFLENFKIIVKPKACFRIDGILIYENRMILKGSNEKESWSQETAILDATSEFIRIVRTIILDEAKLKQIQGYSLLLAKAEEIERKLATGYYGSGEEFNRFQYTKDEDEFWKLVKEFGIQAETAERIREMIRERFKPKPTLFERFMNFFKNLTTEIIIEIIATIIVGILLALKWKEVLNFFSKLFERLKGG